MTRISPLLKVRVFSDEIRAFENGEFTRPCGKLDVGDLYTYAHEKEVKPAKKVGGGFSNFTKIFRKG